MDEEKSADTITQETDEYWEYWRTVAFVHGWTAHATRLIPAKVTSMMSDKRYHELFTEGWDTRNQWADEGTPIDWPALLVHK